MRDGRDWRHSRDLELLAKVIQWLRPEVEYDQVLETLPDYDRALFKRLDEMRARAMKKRPLERRRG